jgi:hypothetical protein
LAALTGRVLASPAVPASIKVYKDPSCGCCTAWVEHLRHAGFTATIESREDINNIKTQLGVPSDLTSCHTGVINGYTIEGHVPAADIRHLIASQPKAKGLAVPGMPMNSPGMEVAGEPNERYTVWLFRADGKREAYAKHGG